MIDFRYHIVSLISVFLALAVGIALGAGPLKETIGDTLTGQVEQLRGEKDALRAELDTTSGALQDAETYIDAAGPAAARRVAHRPSGRRHRARRGRRVAPGPRSTSGSPSRARRSPRTSPSPTPGPTRTRAPSARRSSVSSLTYLDPVAGRRRRRRGRARLRPRAGAGHVRPDQPGRALRRRRPCCSSSSSSSESDSPLVTVADPVTVPADAIVVIGVPARRSPTRTRRPSREPAESVVAPSSPCSAPRRSCRRARCSPTGRAARAASPTPCSPTRTWPRPLTTVSGTERGHRSGQRAARARRPDRGHQRALRLRRRRDAAARPPSCCRPSTARPRVPEGTDATAGTEG